jgi:hypothetical protein
MKLQRLATSLSQSEMELKHFGWQKPHDANLIYGSINGPKELIPFVWLVCLHDAILKSWCMNKDTIATGNVPEITEFDCSHWSIRKRPAKSFRWRWDGWRFWLQTCPSVVFFARCGECPGTFRRCQSRSCAQPERNLKLFGTIVLVNAFNKAVWLHFQRRVSSHRLIWNWILRANNFCTSLLKWLLLYRSFP